jgi:aminoglycoside/choline kinase family phosphotransferase
VLLDFEPAWVGPIEWDRAALGDDALASWSMPIAR